MAKEETKDEMITILRDLQARMTRLEEFIPSVDRVEKRVDLIEQRITATELAVLQEKDMVTGIANNVTDWHSEFNERMQMADEILKSDLIGKLDFVNTRLDKIQKNSR
jgi:hypothetical protein